MSEEQGPRAARGRPSLSEVKRREVRLEIACAAVELFRVHGVEQTSAAEIAEAAGMSLRTLWRYIPSKEEALTALFTMVVEGLAVHLRSWSQTEPVDHRIITDGEQEHMTPRLRKALKEATRLTRTEPGLRKVAMQASFEFHTSIAAAFAARAGRSQANLDDKIHSAMLLAMLNVTDQESAWSDKDDEESRRKLIDHALHTVVAGLPLQGT
ncbi:TetR/AcrR family transcriptional regulator [Streptomyces sp. NPDC002215]|uniref:TetR/AcrR family transcriptional regulator n=1 Tax=Streptomyces sp. NPDC002215 TaxID=3154412 RepID=UPI00332DCBF2